MEANVGSVLIQHGVQPYDIAPPLVASATSCLLWRRDVETQMPVTELRVGSTGSFE